MYTLEEQLRNADRICREAEPRFEKAEAIRAKAEKAAASKKKLAKFVSVAAGFAGLFLGAWIGERLPVGEMLAFLTAPAAGIACYKLACLPAIAAGKAAEEKRAQAEEAEGLRYLDAHAAELSVIPCEYWYPRATGYLVKIVRDGRAGTVNEALRMLDEQIYRWNMEASNESVLAQQRLQTEALNGIRKSSAVNAGVNAARALFRAASWF